MQSFIVFFLGMLTAWALKPTNAAGRLGRWRLLAGGLGAIVPLLEWPFMIVLPMRLELMWEKTFTSILLAPFLCLALSWGLGYFSKKSWRDFFPITLGALIVSLLFNLFTAEGIKPLAPFGQFRLSLDLLYPQDVAILIISWIFLLAGTFIKSFRRDIARAGLVVLLAYVLVLATFRAKAKDFAELYAEAFGLKVETIYALPRPVSPFNWRLVVETEDDRLHHTLVNIYRKKEKKITESSPRAARIDALHLPLNLAQWHIHRRFGSRNTELAETFWQAPVNRRLGDYYTRFMVVQKVEVANGTVCVFFRDVRREKARYAPVGRYRICRPEKAEDGHFVEILE